MERTLDQLSALSGSAVKMCQVGVLNEMAFKLSFAPVQTCTKHETITKDNNDL